MEARRANDAVDPPILPPEPSSDSLRIAIIGNPNAGKTTLFNALTGMRGRTANFPGTTIEKHAGPLRLGQRTIELLDLPGLYSIHAATPEERLARRALLGEIVGERRPDAVLLLLDATMLERNLFLASEVAELGLPIVVALNMTDLAERAGIHIDAKRLAADLGCPVVPVAARLMRGMDELRAALARVIELPGSAAAATPKPPCGCAGCPFEARFDWAEDVGTRCTSGRPMTHGRQTERVDRVLTHPVGGVIAFAAVMFTVFAMIFWVAQYPMGWIEQGFAIAGATVGRLLGPGDLRSLVTNGLIGGVGGVLVFLPQICILFFFLSLLEDTGYLSRAAFVMDRLMRRVGLPGRAFLPMLSAHACAIPAIMSARVIADRRERLLTILVLPLLSCSARIPVYAMIAALLFAGHPVRASLAFTGAYALGIFAALGMAFVFRTTILRGEVKPLVLELPSYKLPSLRNALLLTWDRGLVFVRNAGTMILLVSLILWVLASYPTSAPSVGAAALAERAVDLARDGQVHAAAELEMRSKSLEAQHRLAHSMAGRLGRAIEPVLRPLGFDWQIGVGVISSFAAREVIVSTLAIVYGSGDVQSADPLTITERLAAARRSDGTPVFTPATCLSLLVFYVLAMQCLPTQIVTRRETGSWRWPVFQFAYMSVLAYVGAWIAFQTARGLGLG